MYERIWVLMMQHHLNKIELSKKLGISSGNLSDWSNGRSRPSMSKMIAIADYFNVSLDWLTGRDDRYPDSDPSNYELLQTYAKLDQQGKAVVLGMAYQQLQRCSEKLQANMNGGVKDENDQT